MKTLTPCTCIITLFTLLTLGSSLANAAPLGTMFSYQGRLTIGTNAANGSFDLKFSLYNAASGPAQVGSSLTNTATAVTNGYFTVTLDFGSQFDGNARWLQIEVRTNGGGAFTPLNPRQPLNPGPYALFASNTATLGGQAPGYYAPASGSTAYVAKSGDTMTGALAVPNHDVSAKRLIASDNAIEGGNLQLRNPGKTNAAYCWTLYNMSGYYGNSFQLWSYGDPWYGPMFIIYDDHTTVLSPSGGNVGIGTGSPQAETEVFGAGQLTAALTDAGNRGGMLMLNTDSTLAGNGGALLFGNVQSHNANTLGFAAIKGLLQDGSGKTTGDLAFSTRNATADTALTERMRITSSGNVGIGTPSPAAKLEVQGGPIKATGGLIIETRTSDPPSPVTGQMWLRTDL